MTATAEARARASSAPAEPTLRVENLRVAVDGREILHGVDFTINKGEVHAILGPNGSGKSTLAYALMGSPRYEVTDGAVTFKGEDLLAMATDERARAGLFLAFQYPTSIPGVQMAMLRPEVAIMDETDSGLDVDAFHVVADGVNAMRGPDLGIVVITHYNRMLEYIKPDFVHVLIGGKIVKDGGAELSQEVDRHGYQPILEELRAKGVEIELPEEAGATYGGREETEERRDPFRSHGRTAI